MLEAIIIPCGCGQHPLTFTRKRPPQALLDAAALILTPRSTLREAFERGIRDLSISALHAQFMRSALGGAL